MTALLARFRYWLARRRKLYHVLLTYDDGGVWLAGPMTHFGAELFVVGRMWDDRARRVASARIVQP